ncbi:MAG TPA: thiol reductant ABC exporter subunit CydC [Propionibacteriaceae bacterium]|nr:thiol reductant ABC exporter subunit CydC [Propionibacteriaceae bacterium]
MRELLGLVRPGPATLAVLLGTGVVLTGAALLATSGALITGAAQRPSSLLVLLPLITGVRLFAVSRASLRYAERLVAHDVTLRLVGQLRVRLLERLAPLAPAALTGARGGEVLARVRADTDALQGLFVRLVAPAAVAVFAGTVAVGLTAVVSPPLAGVLAALLLVLGVAVPAWARYASRMAAPARAAADAAFGADFLDLVRGLPTHLTGDGGRTALAMLEADLARQGAAERAAARVNTVTTVAREGIPALGVVAALWLVGTDVAAGGTNPALLAAAALGVLAAFEAVGGLGTAWAAAPGIRAAAVRVRGLVEQEPAVIDIAEPVPAPSSTTLQLDAVTLSYPGAAVPALADFSLVVGADEKVALVGPSGAGKSSVLALAMRFRDPDAGQVRLGGVDLPRLALADVRAASAWADQTPQILGGSVADNLRLARPEASDAQLLAVLAEVGLDLTLEELHRWIGQAGERLSAGERARIAVARALLSSASRLLLDEPTAHLDEASAERLLERLAEDPRSVLLVTHAPERLDPRWRVVVLDGRPVDVVTRG